MSEIKLQGIPASEGIAVGPAFRFTPEPLQIPDRPGEGTDQELARFQSAVDRASAALRDLRQQVRSRADEGSAAIFDAQLMMLEDPLLRQGVQARLQAGDNAERALWEAIEELAGKLELLRDERLAGRAADVRDIGARLLRILLNQPAASLEGIPGGSIILAGDLNPSDTAGMDSRRVGGFCTEAGGLTSHTAILARTLGIPAVVGLGSGALASIQDGRTLAIDGGQGLLLVDPSPAALEGFRQAQIKHEERRAAMAQAAAQPARSSDGHPVRVAANIGGLASAKQAVASGADEVGLLRAEFLYLRAARPPDEQTQVAAYGGIFQALGGRPIIVRTLDLGGDKPPSFLEFPQELNPFLGWRAIRVCLDQPDLFKTQLRAILRAAVGHQVSIMYPMINDLEELRRSNECLAQARQELQAQGLPFAEPQQIGTMIETPAAALLADQLAEECDFVSLGTNDLTQYTLAVDRTNERVARFFQPLHPALLRLIASVIQAVHARGKWVGMCGEMAGMRTAIPLLLGLGLDEFSMVPGAIPEAKWLIRQLTLSAASDIADQALQMKTASAVNEFMSGVIERLASGGNPAGA